MHLFFIKFLGSSKKSESNRLLDFIMAINRWSKRVINNAFEVWMFRKLYEFRLLDRSKEIKLV